MHFAIRIYDVPDSGSLRDIHRKEHLDYLLEFNDQTLFAGPILTEDLTTELGSMRLIEFPDRAAAEKHVADEPYVRTSETTRTKAHLCHHLSPGCGQDNPDGKNAAVRWRDKNGGHRQGQKSSTSYHL